MDSSFIPTITMKMNQCTPWYFYIAMGNAAFIKFSACPIKMWLSRAMGLLPQENRDWLQIGYKLARVVAYT